MRIYDYNGKKNICGDRVHEARRKLRLTQNDLAARLLVIAFGMVGRSLHRRRRAR